MRNRRENRATVRLHLAQDEAVERQRDRAAAHALGLLPR